MRLTHLLAAAVMLALGLPTVSLTADLRDPPPIPARAGGGGAASTAPVGAVPATAPPTDLPEEAKKIIEEYQKKEAEVRKKIEMELEKEKQKLIADLQKLQDDYTKKAMLDEAVAVRDRLRELKNGKAAAPVNVAALPDPGSLGAYRGQNGKVLYFEVTGNAQGAIWGTGIYTDDTSLATASVHAGLLQQGQKGIVKVTIVEAQPAYQGTNQNGVASSDYGAWGGSYKVERVR